MLTKDPMNRHKKRLCIDYSQTVNLYTDLDAYPLPRIDDYKYFQLLTYHQIQIRETDKKYTGFEANGQLYQFCCIPFRVTNGVAVFQREMDKLVEDKKLLGTFPYVDNITIAGHDQEDHDKNLHSMKLKRKCQYHLSTL